MGQITIVEFRCFGAAEMPTLEVFWVYMGDKFLVVDNQRIMFQAIFEEIP
jgi:hypothetical protein